MPTLVEKAERLLALHNFEAGRGPLLLPNVWNPIGARVLAAKGFPAVATASAAVSASLGFQDGEKLKRSTLIDILGRITTSVDVPVTADVERGYGDSLPELSKTIKLLIDAGVAGINIEDSLEEGGELRRIDEQCERIAAVRETAAACGVHLVINTRVDCFLTDDAKTKTEKLEEAQIRAAAYTEAGADCIYPVGPGDEETVRQLRERISAPINIIASSNSASVAQLAEIGVNRISFGPFVFRACMSTFTDIADALLQGSKPDALNRALSGDEVAGFLSEPPEGL